MNVSEACELLVESVRAQSAIAAERDVWRMLALVALQHAHDLGVQREDVQARYHRALDEARHLRADIIIRSEQGRHCAA